MTAYVPYNTTQKVRLFMESLGFTPPLNATSAEIVDLLIERVRERRRDQNTRRNFQGLLAALSRPAAAAENYPTPECEHLNPAALAEELGWLLEERSARLAQTDGPRAIAPLLAAAILLIGLTVSAGCGDGNDESDASSIYPPSPCAEDTSTNHFEDLIGQSDDLTQADIENAIDQYQSFDDQYKTDVINDLCAMSPEDIATYINNGYHHDDNDDNEDAEPAYKGVTF